VRAAVPTVLANAVWLPATGALTRPVNEQIAASRTLTNANIAEILGAQKFSHGFGDRKKKQGGRVPGLRLGRKIYRIGLCFVLGGIAGRQ
jgi:hypothetical protein